MKIRSFPFATGALALGFAAGLATLVLPCATQAQEPRFDRVSVTLPYSVTIGDKTLQPGNYVIQQLDSEIGGAQVVMIYGDDGMKFQTSILTIPALENRTQPDTRVTLHHIGNDYYLDKVWVQGKNYGYEFPLPDNVKQRENEAAEPVVVTANASSVPANPPAAPQPTPVPEPAVTQPETAPPAIAPRTATPPATDQSATPQQTTADRADESAPATPAPAMPHTDSGWLLMLLSGGTLSGLGVRLRRKR